MLQHSAPGRRNWGPIVPYVTIGGASVIVGGLISAATAHAPSRQAAWAAAYLVLVAGAAQIGLALAMVVLTARPLSSSRLGAQFAAWNLGNALVLAGTLTERAWLVDVGGGLLVAALAAAVWATRARVGHRGLRYGFRVLVLILLVSIPIGLVLARK